jgi:hypothetical protein
MNPRPQPTSHYVLSIFSFNQFCMNKNSSTNPTWSILTIIRLRLFRQSCIFYLLCNYFHVHIHNILGLRSFYPHVMLCLVHVPPHSISSYSCICHSMHFHTFYQCISPQTHLTFRGCWERYEMVILPFALFSYMLLVQQL